MIIQNTPFSVINWDTIEKVAHPGAPGTALWRTITVSDTIRVRIVEYSAGYIADHWCSKGHIILVLEGELETELQDGRKFTLSAGMGYQVADGAEPHRSSTKNGVKLYIVD